jgi:hypothetical protein
MAMNDAPAGSPPVQPIALPVEQLEQLSEELSHRDFGMKRLDAALAANGDRGEALKALQNVDPTLNAQALEDVNTFRQEGEKKKAWYSKVWGALGTGVSAVASGVKEAAKKTGEVTMNTLKSGWGFVKRHPVLTSAAAIAILGVAAYYFGIIPGLPGLWQEEAGAAVDTAIGEHGSTAIDALSQNAKPNIIQATGQGGMSPGALGGGGYTPAPPAPMGN